MGQDRALVIKNGKVLLPTEELRSSDVLIEEGRIQEIGPSLTSDVQIDARDGYVLPGMAITAVGAAMLWILARRATAGSPAPTADAVEGTASGNLTAEDAARLEAELADLDS